MSVVDAQHGEGRIAATVATITDDQMERMAGEIVSLARHYVLDNDRT